MLWFYSRFDKMKMISTSVEVIKQYACKIMMSSFGELQRRFVLWNEKV